jgi:hypothetical protein
MLITPIEHAGLDLLKSDLVRSPGVHASDIFGPLFAELEPQRYNYTSAPNPMLLALGTAWEKHLEYLLAKNDIAAVRPDEFMSPEGIAYSPDLLIFNGVTRLGEIKYTSQSSKGYPTEPANHLPPKADKYLCQMMLYAYWLELHDGWLAIVFNHQSWNPELRIFEITWTDRELADNHTMLMNYAKQKGLL